MTKKHILIIALAAAIILMLAACVNENLNLSETTPSVSGTKDPTTSETDAQTQDPSETTGDDGGFWLPPDEF